VELRAGFPGGAGGACILLAVRVKLVDQRFFSVDELVDDLHEWRDLGGARLMNLLEDLVIPETFLVAVDDLVIPDADTGVAVLEEPVGVVVLLTVYIHIKVHMDLQADKSPVVVKGPFFPRVVNPRYRIRGTNVQHKDSI
jgi:hypothetical protein